MVFLPLHTIRRAMPSKPKPKPLSVTQRAIKEEQVNVVKRTEKRIRQLLGTSEDSTDTEQVSVATQTDCTLATDRQARNFYLNACCFSVLVVCMNLLLFQ
jgi:hypothetical protein